MVLFASPAVVRIIISLITHIITECFLLHQYICLIIRNCNILSVLFSFLGPYVVSSLLIKLQIVSVILSKIKERTVHYVLLKVLSITSYFSHFLAAHGYPWIITIFDVFIWCEVLLRQAMCYRSEQAIIGMDNVWWIQRA